MALLYMYKMLYMQVNTFNLPIMFGIEVLCIDVDSSQEGHRVVFLYRFSSVPQKSFLANIEAILKWLHKNRSRKLLLLGDPNIDLLKLPSSPLISMMEDFGLKQVVSEPTHRTGSCLDHSYLVSARRQSCSCLLSL